MREGPWAKIGAMAGVIAAVLTYLGLALNAKWFPFAEPGNGGQASGTSIAPGAVSTGSAPQVKASESPSGFWIAQLASVPTSAGSGQLQSELAAVRSEIPGAEYLDSSDYASLRPGYWVIYYSDGFRNGDDALAYCGEHGRMDRNQCVGRFLSHSTSDAKYMCLPPAGSQTAGCYR